MLFAAICSIVVLEEASEFRSGAAKDVETREKRTRDAKLKIISNERIDRTKSRECVMNDCGSKETGK